MSADTESPGEQPDESSTPALLRSVLSSTGRDLWRCLPDLLIYDILFELIAFVVLTPPVAWLLRRFVATSGNSAVGNVDIARFLLTPLGLVMSLLLAALFCTITFGKLAGLTYIGYGATRDRRFTYFDALRFVSARGVKIFFASVIGLLVLAITALPFLVVALLAAKALLTEHDINYYLDARPAEYSTAIAIGAVLIVLAVIALAAVTVPMVFVLPRTLLSVDDPGDMLTMIDRGVDNIITNDPAALAGVLDERESLDNAERILLRFKSLYVD